MQWSLATKLETWSNLKNVKVISGCWGWCFCINRSIELSIWIFMSDPTPINSIASPRELTRQNYFRDSYDFMKLEILLKLWKSVKPFSGETNLGFLTQIEHRHFGQLFGWVKTQVEPKHWCRFWKFVRQMTSKTRIINKRQGRLLYTIKLLCKSGAISSSLSFFMTIFVISALL